MPLPHPPDEPERQAALRRLGVFDTPPEEEFDDLTRLAATICGTPIALVSLLDTDRQWFKSRYGLDATETPRAWAFCDHAVRQPALFEVPDAAADGRFADNPLVTSDPRIRFYAGMPLTTPEGVAVGTLCVIDRTPRTLSATQKDALRTLARQVVAQLTLREQLRSTVFQLEQHETFRVLFEHSSDAHLIFDEHDGILDCNAAAVAMLRSEDKSEVLALHPAALSPEFQPCGRRSMEKCIDMDARARRDGYHRFDWTHRRMDGEEFPCEVTLTPVQLHGRSVLLVVWHDLTERKKIEDALRASEERFRAAMEGSLAAVYFLTAERDAGGRITDFVFSDLNHRGAELISHEREGVLGRRLCELLPVNRADGFFDKYVRVVETGRTLDEEFPIAAEGIAAGWLHHQVVRVGDGVAITSQDVTAEKRAEHALRESEERFRGMVENLSEGVVIIDPDTLAVLRTNRALLDLLGLTAEEAAGLRKPDIAAHTPHESAERMRRVLADGRADLGLCRYRRKGGGLVNVSVSGSRITLDGRTVVCLVVRDMTQVIQAEQAVRSSEDQLRDILENTDEMVHRFGLDMEILYTNRAWRKTLGYTEDEAKGLTLARIVHPEDKPILQANYARLMAGERVCVEARLVTKSGAAVLVSGVSEMRFDGDGPVYGRTLFRDVTEQRANEELVTQYQAELERANARLKTLAHTDALTGVNNRAAFNERLTEEFARAGRYDRPLSVVLLDVDHFKQFNDSFGHPAGDDVLQRVAGLLRQTVRLTDFVSRYGGEEFVVLLPDTDRAGAMVLAERCRRAIAGGEWDRRGITISVGVSTLTATTADASALVKEADDALYTSKHAGRNRVHHSSGTTPALATTLR